MRKVRDYRILGRIASLKAYVQVESNTEWMELVFTKQTQASIYNSVTVGFARNSTYGFFFSHLTLPIQTVHTVPNECKKLVPFLFFIDS